ncbi:MAG: membrane protein insertion efficiency factor YidD [Nitrospinaceae bacterium]|nr:membrane protein insertion efficiency factor YidD [Nitrospinaceae bacterium]
MINGSLIKFIRLYQRLLSPFLPAGCRFYPTCSEYSAQALERYNVFKALGLSLVRLLKCHPYHGGGSDPVK